MPRSFGLEKLKRSRRSSEPSILDIKTHSDRRNSLSNPMVIISESFDNALHSRGYTSGDDDDKPPNSHQNHRIRAQSMSLINSHSRSRSRSKSRSISGAASPLPGSTKKHVKELIKQETTQIISKKLLSSLQELGLQNPIPLKTTNGSYNGSISKTTKLYVANTNDVIYLAPSSSASFTYEDVENGGNSHNTNNLGVDDLLNMDNQYNEDEDESAILSDSEDFLSSSQFNDNVRRHSNSFDNTPISDPNLNATPQRLQQKMESFSSPNYLCTKIDSDHPIPHTFAVIVELSKDTRSIRDVKFEFQSLTNILWPSGDPYSKTHVREKFKIGHMEWNTTLSDADYYINSSNTNDVKTKKISSDDLARRTREYKLINIRDLAEGNDSVNRSRENSTGVHATHSSSSTSLNSTVNSTSNGVSNDIYKAGLYVFLLPILLPEHIPPTIVSINGSLEHTLSISFTKTSDKINRKVKVLGKFSLPMVRTPPSFANSIADKPIYVNRIWNDSLHYIITFPKKYVALGAEHVVNVKLVPLVKDVIIKRIKFNVLERITYVSKNLSKEYDYDGEDPYFLKPLLPDNKVRERVISVCELKTKSKASSSNPLNEPYKEEVIKCIDNNFLHICYESDNEPESFNLNDSGPKEKDSMNTIIASPLDINIALPFLTTRSDKTIVTSSISDDISRRASVADNHRKALSKERRSSSVTDPLSQMSPGLPPSSPIIGALETNVSHVPHFTDELNISDVITPDSSNYISDSGASTTPGENMQLGITSVPRALYPDSNFRNIQIHHRLQVCFRISKPDPKDDYRMHHYEVVVDTPLILVSAKCNEDSIQLPEYDDIYSSQSTEGVASAAPESSSSSSAAPPPSIAFRTPNFERNGISIRPLVDQLDDQLPSFEQATSDHSSPITRTFSIGEDPLSRASSISGLSPTRAPSVPNEPAPAYQPPQPSSRRASSEPLNIDELVDYNSLPSTSTSGTSRLRSSLVNSFAPVDRPERENPREDDGSINIDSGSSSSSYSGPIPSSETNSTPSSSIAPSSAIAEQAQENTTQTEPIRSMNSDLTNVAACGIPVAPIDISRPETLPETTPGSHFKDEVVSDSDSEEGDCESRDFDDQTSLTTQETYFSQRLPLLHYVSGETIPTRKRLNRVNTTSSVLAVPEETDDEDPYSANNISSLSINGSMRTSFGTTPQKFEPQL